MINLIPLVCPARARDFRQKAEGDSQHCKDDNPKVVGDGEGQQDNRGKTQRTEDREEETRPAKHPQKLSSGPRDWERL